MSGSISNQQSGNFIGSGPDTITLLMSGDAFGPAGAPGADPLFTLNVDGQQIGGLQDVSASKSAGQEQAFTFAGDFAPGQHQIAVTFANNSGTQGDQTDFGRGGDRNVYVDQVSYNGQVISNVTTPIYESPLFPPNGFLRLGNAVFGVNDSTGLQNGGIFPTTTPGAVDAGSGADTLTLNMSEDPFQGDAQFTVAVDGQQVGGTLTTTAVAWQGQTQAFNLHGDWGSGGHTITVSFLNDAAGAFTAAGAIDNVDRNLYVNSISYDGVSGSGTPWELASAGSQSFNVPAGGQPGASNATITSQNLQSGSNGMSFIAPIDTASTSTSSNSGSGSGTSSDTSGTTATDTSSGSGSTPTTDTSGSASTAAAVTGSNTTQTTQDFSATSGMTGSTNQTSSTGQPGSGAWWAQHSAGGGGHWWSHHAAG